MNEPSGFTPISETLKEISKEIHRRYELRQRLEAELTCPLTDEEFILIAERDGVRI